MGILNVAMPGHACGTRGFVRNQQHSWFLRLGSVLLLSILAFSPLHSASTPDPDYEDSLWLGDRTDLIRLDPDTGDLVTRIEGVGDIRASTIDDHNGLVWFFAGEHLHAFDFAGNPKMAVQLPLEVLESFDLTSLHDLIASDGEDSLCRLVAGGGDIGSAFIAGGTGAATGALVGATGGLGGAALINTAIRGSGLGMFSDAGGQLIGFKMNRSQEKCAQFNLNLGSLLGSGFGGAYAGVIGRFAAAYAATVGEQVLAETSAAIVSFGPEATASAIGSYLGDKR